MGLDNGIQITRSNYSNNIPALKFYAYDWDTKQEYDFEVCYWRKCWNIRQGIYNILEKNYHISEQNDFKFVLSREDVKEIIKFLCTLNKKNWDNSGNFWHWKEYRFLLVKNIFNLIKLYFLMKKYPKLEVYFYDSY